VPNSGRSRVAESHPYAKHSATGARCRATVTARAADNGATVAELEAIFGWQGGGMASLYTRATDRARLAKGAMSKLARTTGEQTIPAPSGKVRDSARKERRYQMLGNQVVGAQGLEPGPAD